MDSRTFEAAVTTTIRLRFDERSARIRLPLKGYWVHRDVTRAADPQAVDRLTYLFIQAAAQQPGRDVGRRMVVARSNRSRIVVVTTALPTDSRRSVALVGLSANELIRREAWPRTCCSAPHGDPIKKLDERRQVDDVRIIRLRPFVRFLRTDCFVWLSHEKKSSRYLFSWKLFFCQNAYWTFASNWLSRLIRNRSISVVQTTADLLYSGVTLTLGYRDNNDENNEDIRRILNETSNRI